MTGLILGLIQKQFPGATEGMVKLILIAVFAAIALGTFGALRGCACISQNRGKPENEEITITRTDSRNTYRNICVSLFGEKSCPEKK